MLVHYANRTFIVAATLCLLSGADGQAVCGQQLLPLATPTSNNSGTVQDRSSKELQPLLPIQVSEKPNQVEPLPISAAPEGNNKSWPPFGADFDQGTVLTGERSDLDKEPGSEYVQAVFELPGPTVLPQEEPPVIPEGLVSKDYFAPQKNESLREVERELNQALRDGSGGMFDTLLMEDFFQTAVAPYRVYRGSEATISVLPRSSRNLGWTSLEWEPYLKRSQQKGLTGSIQHHFLNGPLLIDLPPRLHDFVLGYQHRGQIRERFSFDCAASIGIFSDFKGSAREGIRFPAHAVGIIHASHRADFVFGVDYLDRDDYPILPVLGISWHDLNYTALRYDLVFPRPRIDFTTNEGQRYYLAGRLGGGTWDMEYPSGIGDVMTYRDFRILLGKESRYMDGSRHSFEIGYVLGRKLMMRQTLAELDFSNAMILRFVSSY